MEHNEEIKVTDIILQRIDRMDGKLDSLCEKLASTNERLTKIEIKADELAQSRSNVMSNISKVVIPIAVTLITVFFVFQLEIWKTHFPK